MDLLVHTPESFKSVIVGGSGVFTAPMSPERIAAIASAFETDDVSDITDSTALFFRQFAESR
jgi:hypothetical protein